MPETWALAVAVILAVALVFNRLVDSYQERVHERMAAARKADKKRRSRQAQS